MSSGEQRFRLPSVSLSVFRHGDELHFTMQHKNYNHVQQEDYRKVNKSRREQIRELLYDFKELDRGQLEDAEKLKSIGEWLFLNLLPEEFQKQIRELDVPLSIKTNDPSIPWEILHDTSDFLAMRLPLSRHLILKSAMGSINSIVDSVVGESNAPFRSLLIADPEENLAFAREERKILQPLFEKQGECDVLMGREATHEEVLHLLRRNEYSIIHFAGHMNYDEEDGTSYIRFLDRRILASDEVGRIVRGNPIVFLNACMADFRSETEGRPTPSQGRASIHIAESFAESFMMPTQQGMALAVISTMWKVPDDQGVVDLTDSFYNKLFEGETLGGALQQSRCLSRENGCPPMVWAPYILYGDPCQTLFSEEEDKAAPEDEKMVKPDKGAMDVLLHLSELSRGKMKYITSSHLLLALCKSDSERLKEAAGLFNVRLESVEAKARELIDIMVAKMIEITGESEWNNSKLGVSDSVKEALKGAQDRAVQSKRELFTVDDILFCLVSKDSSTAANLLKRCGVLPEAVRLLIQGKRVAVNSSSGNQNSFHRDVAGFKNLMSGLSEDAKKALQTALQLAVDRGGGILSTGHLFVGLVHSGSVATSVICAKGGIIDDSELAGRILNRLSGSRVGDRLLSGDSVPEVSKRIVRVIGRAREKAAALNLAKADDALLISEIFAETDGLIFEEISEMGHDSEVLHKSSLEYLSRSHSN